MIYEGVENEPVDIQTSLNTCTVAISITYIIIRSFDFNLIIWSCAHQNIPGQSSSAQAHCLFSTICIPCPEVPPDILASAKNCTKKDPESLLNWIHLLLTHDLANFLWLQRFQPLPPLHNNFIILFYIYCSSMPLGKRKIWIIFRAFQSKFSQALAPPKEKYIKKSPLAVRQTILFLSQIFKRYRFPKTCNIIMKQIVLFNALIILSNSSWSIWPFFDELLKFLHQCGLSVSYTSNFTHHRVSGQGMRSHDERRLSLFVSHDSHERAWTRMNTSHSFPSPPQATVVVCLRETASSSIFPIGLSAH